MTRQRPRRGLTPRLVFTSCLLIGLAPGAARGQAVQASIGAGAGTVRYDGGSRFSSASISPGGRFDSPNFAGGMDGTLASLPDGVWSSQGRADAWLASPAVFGSWRLGLQLSAAGTHANGSWSAAAHGVGELFWSAANWGVGLGAGPSAGWTAREPRVTAFHARARLWGRAGAVAYTLAVEPQRFLGAWFTDANAGLTVAAGAVNAVLWGGTRLSGAYGSSVGGGAFAQVFVSPRVALEVAGGVNLREPYQGFPQAAYASLGLRLHASPRLRAPAREAQLLPLLAERVGDSVRVRFRMEGAASVAIAGDWNAWQPQALVSRGAAVWEGTLLIPPGTHPFNLVVDGKDWVVPAGIATAKDDLGGLTGLLLVR